MISIAANYNEPFGGDNKIQKILNLTGGGLLVAGQVFFAVGVPTWAIGRGKKNGVLEDFSRQYHSISQTSAHFQLNLWANGVGLSYVFGENN